MATSTRPDDPAVTDGDARRIGTVAVVAHRKKTLGGGLDELLWFEVKKSKKAPKRVREAVKAGADLVVVWGGEITIALGEPRAYELDGGERDTADRLTACVVPGGITVRVPDAGDQTRK